VTGVANGWGQDSSRRPAVVFKVHFEFGFCLSFDFGLKVKYCGAERFVKGPALTFDSGQTVTIISQENEASAFRPRSQ